MRIPTYNQLHFLKESVASTPTQMYPNLEIFDQVGGAERWE
jgi:glycosyltransferase involved in cell wall biosynthesis